MMGFGMMILQFLFWILIIYVAVRFLRGIKLGGGSNGNNGDFMVHTNNPERAEEILKQRYAKGEITREQYREMLEDIK